jgi:hypothetical protein
VRAALSVRYPLGFRLKRTALTLAGTRSVSSSSSTTRAISWMLRCYSLRW